MEQLGFEITEKLVGYDVSFDIIRIENKGVLEDITDYEGHEYRLDMCQQSANAIECVIDKYYEKKPEIRKSTTGGRIKIFRFRAYYEDIEPLLDILSYCIVLQIEVFNPSYSKRHEGGIRVSEMSEKGGKIKYSKILEESGCSIGEPSWDRLSDKSIDVEEHLEEKIPDGYDSPKFTEDRFRNFVYDRIKPELHHTDVPEGTAWQINLGIHELRKGRYEEAAYAFDAVRNSICKSPHPYDFPEEIEKLLNRYLISLRDLCSYHSQGDMVPHANQELFIELEKREYVFVPVFTSTPGFYDPNFRFSSHIWISNALVFAFSFALSLASPTISRSEVDPFGSKTMVKNRSFVLAAARNLFEKDKKIEGGGKELRYLDYINFEEFAPEVILSGIFESLGYEVVGTLTDSEYSEHYEDISKKPDILLKKEKELYFIYYQMTEVSEVYSDFEHYDDITLILVSSTEYSESAIKLSKSESDIEMYYLDSMSNSLRDVDSGLPLRRDPPVTEEEVRDRLEELYNSARKADTSQRKGEILEELTQIIFEKLIPDTEVLRTNSETGSEEFDVIVRNEQENNPWKELSNMMLVECKNWSKTVGRTELDSIKEKMDTLGGNCKCGILVAWSGISGDKPGEDAYQKIREAKREDEKYILVMTSEDIREIIKSNSPSKIFDEAYIDVVTEY
jgi:hypothetical protein